MKKVASKLKRLVSKSAGSLHIKNKSVVSQIDDSPAPITRQKQKLIYGGVTAAVILLVLVVIFRGSALTNQFVAGEILANLTGTADVEMGANASNGSYVRFGNAPGTGGPTGKRCVLGVPGGGGNETTYGGDGYDVGPDFETIRSTSANPDLNSESIPRVNAAGCGQVIVHGFSEGGRWIKQWYCTGVDVGGKAIGFIVDDPNFFVSDDSFPCAPAPGMKVQLYATRCNGRWTPDDWLTYLGIGYTVMARIEAQLGIPTVQNPHDKGYCHYPYTNPSPPEIAGPNAWWNDGSGPSPTVTPTTTPTNTPTVQPTPTPTPTTGGPTGTRCVMGLPGSGGDDRANPGSGAFGSGASYDQGNFTTLGSNNNESPASIKNRINAAGCGQVILHGFSMGGGMAVQIFCSGENYEGRLVGLVADDPTGAPGGCAAQPGVQRVLFATGGGPGSWIIDGCCGSIAATGAALGVQPITWNSAHVPMMTFEGIHGPENVNWWN